MAMERVPGGMFYPQVPPFPAGLPAFVSTALTCNASGHSVACILKAPKSGVLDGFEILLGSSPVAANGLRFSFQTVGTSSGDPDGTVDQYRIITPASGWNASGLMTSDGTDSGAKRTVARDEVIACVVDFPSFSSGDSFSARQLNANSAQQVPYTYHFTSTGVRTGEPLCLALKYEDGTYPFLQGNIYPVSTLSSISLNPSPAEIAMAFQFPSEVLLGGASFRMTLPSSGDPRMVLYGPDNEELSSSLIRRGITRSVSSSLHVFSFFSRDIKIRANETYRLAIRGGIGTAAAVQGYNVASSDLLHVLEGGPAWVWASRSDYTGSGASGTWTEIATRRPWAHLLVTGIDHEIGGSPSTGYEGES